MHFLWIITILAHRLSMPSSSLLSLYQILWIMPTLICHSSKLLDHYKCNSNLNNSSSCKIPCSGVLAIIWINSRCINSRWWWIWCNKISKYNNNNKWINRIRDLCRCLSYKSKFLTTLIVYFMAFKCHNSNSRHLLFNSNSSLCSLEWLTPLICINNNQPSNSRGLSHFNSI